MLQTGRLVFETRQEQTSFSFPPLANGRRDFEVGTVKSLCDGRQRNRGSIPGSGETFLYSVHTSSGNTQTRINYMDTRSYFTGGKAAPSSAKEF